MHNKIGQQQQRLPLITLLSVMMDVTAVVDAYDEHSNEIDGDDVMFEHLIPSSYETFFFTDKNYRSLFSRVSSSRKRNWTQNTF